VTYILVRRFCDKKRPVPYGWAEGPWAEAEVQMEGTEEEFLSIVSTLEDMGFRFELQALRAPYEGYVAQSYNSKTWTRFCVWLTDEEVELLQPTTLDQILYVPTERERWQEDGKWRQALQKEDSNA
jgi:hypothetical protein